MSDPNMPPPPWDDGSGGQSWGQPPPADSTGGQSWGQDQSWVQGAPGGATPQPWGGAAQARPSSMLPWSIAATLLCCLPAGIAAIVFASKADTAFSTGDYAGGMRYHGQARTWTIASVVIGPILIGVFIVMIVLGGLASTF